MSKSYPVEVETETGWTRWITPASIHKIKCCDCGLVHNFQFRVADDGRVEFRAQRNNRSTAQIRRHRK